MRLTWMLAIGLAVCSAVNLRAQDSATFASEDGKEYLRIIGDDEVDIRRNGSDYLLAGYYQELDTGEIRVTVMDQGRDEVLYYTVDENVLTTATGKKLTLQPAKEIPDSPGRRRAQRVHSAGNMKQLGLAMLMYSGDNDGFFPRSEGAAGLEILNAEDVLDAGKVYVNPRDTRKAPEGIGSVTEATTSYAYIGAGLKDDNDWATMVPILVEKPTADDWVNFLFIDGHVEGVPVAEKSMEAAVKAFYAKGRGLPKEVQEDVLKRARKADAIEKAQAPAQP